MAKQKATALNLAEVAVNLESAEKARLAYRALFNPLRTRLLTLLDKAKGKGKNVTSIYKELKIEQSVASQHLAILRRSNFVKAVRAGKTITYTVNYEKLKTLNKASGLLAV